MSRPKSCDSDGRRRDRDRTGTEGLPHEGTDGQPGAIITAATKPRCYHSTVTLDPAWVGRDAGRIADEVVAHLAALVDASVSVSLEIDADVPDGVPDNVVRTVAENSLGGAGDAVVGDSAALGRPHFGGRSIVICG